MRSSFVVLSLLVSLLIGCALACKCAVQDGSEHCAPEYTSDVVVIRGVARNKTLSDDGSHYTYLITVDEVLFNNAGLPVFYRQGLRVQTAVGAASCEASLNLNESYFMRIDIVKSKTGRFEFHLSSCSFVIKANPWDAASNLSCGELTDDCLRYPCRPDQKCEDASISCFTIPCPQRTCV